MLPLKILASLCVVSLVFLHSHIPLFSSTANYPRSTTSHPYCFLFDRPPRTGSSTTGLALRRCLKTHGYIQPPHITHKNRVHSIQQMLALPHDRVALMSRHIYISKQDIQLLRHSCQRLFYITSARPMRERVWSALKYSFVGRDYKGNVPDEIVEQAKKSAMNNTHLEPYLEEYPYMESGIGDVRDHGWGVQSDERLVPDYVVRSNKLEVELTAFLEQLGCDISDMGTRNVHQVKGAGEAPRIQLAHGDRVYRWLDALAENGNAAGLEKVKEFARKPADLE